MLIWENFCITWNEVVIEKEYQGKSNGIFLKEKPRNCQIFEHDFFILGVKKTDILFIQGNNILSWEDCSEGWDFFLTFV